MKVRTIQYSVGLCLYFSFFSGMYCRSLTPEQIEQLESFTETVMECRHNLGISMALVREDETVYANGLGYREYDNQLEMTPDTRIAISSNSKSFTGLLASDLVDRGLLTWTTPIQDILGPEFELEGEFRTQQTTMRDCLGHKLGMYTYWGESTATPNCTREELCMRRLRYFDSAYEHRDLLKYSNYPFVLAGYVMEVLTGKTWEELTNENIFQPLGMSNSMVSADITEEDWQNTAYSHLYVDGEYYRNPDEDQLDFLTGIAPSAAIFSTANDMAKYLKFHLSEGKNEADEQVMSPTAVRDVRDSTFYRFDESPNVRRPRFPVDDCRMAYAYGLVKGTYRGYEKIEHTGSNSAYNCRMTMLPDAAVGVWICSNSPGDAPTPIRLIAHFALDLLLDEEPWLNETTGCTFPDPWLSDKQRDESPKVRAPPISPMPQRPLTDYEGVYLHPGLDTFSVYINQTTETLYYRHGLLLNGELLPANERDEFDMIIHYPLYYQHVLSNTTAFPLEFGTNGDDEITTVKVDYLEFDFPPVFEKESKRNE